MAVAVAGGGCAEDQSVPESGNSLHIPLSQPGPDGMSTYYLRGATFEITDDGGTDLLVDGGGDDPTVIVSLDPGLYEVRLLDGWHMERVIAGQPPENVPALLASHNPVVVLVQAQAPAFAGFQFLLGTTEGPLSISFGIAESWLAYGSMYFATNEPSAGSTAFADVPVGGSAAFALHFTAGQAYNYEVDGEQLLQISMGPLAASFFGGAAFESEVSAGYTGSYQFVQVHVDELGACSFDDTTFSSLTNDDGVYYHLSLTGPSCIAMLDVDGHIQVDNLQLIPQFELSRYQDGVLTDRLTGTLSMVFSTE
jgi:hypothetical protein